MSAAKGEQHAAQYAALLIGPTTLECCACKLSAPRVHCDLCVNLEPLTALTQCEFPQGNRAPP
jgi:hypothetical protein